MDRFPANQQPEKSKRSDLDSPKLLHELRERGVKQTSKGEVSRRDFLFGAGAAAATAVIGLDRVQIGDSDFHKKVNEFKGGLEKLYGVRIVMGPPHGEEHIRGDITTLKTYADTLTLISQEFSKYPLGMIQKVSNKRRLEIRVMDKLASTETASFDVSAQAKNQPVAVGGLMEEKVNGKEEARITLNTSVQAAYLRRVLHHELNHRFSREWEGWNQRTRKWARFNSTSVLNPYRPVPLGTKGDTPTRDRRFLTLFASSSAEEDQAVCAEWMMTPRLHADFLERIEDEQDENIKAILAAKYDEIIDTYKRWSGGKINEAFWQAIIDQGHKEKQNAERKG